MMKINLALAMLGTLSLVATGCKGDEPALTPIDQLPPATQTGAYTFGCLVNGIARVAENTNDIGAIYQEDILQMYAGFDLDPGRQEVVIDVRSILEAGQEYDLTNDPFDAVAFDWGGGYVPCGYDEENTLSGTLIITHFDDEEYIVSGTFEFVTATEGCDTIRVTDGRFDIPYIP